MAISITSRYFSFTYSDVLSLADPITNTGRTYKLSKIEMENTSNILAKKVIFKNFFNYVYTHTQWWVFASNFHFLF